MRVSACLIVRNEAVHLGACLASIQPVVDEIIVVDTGSTDNTVAIAQSYGAQVYHFPWCDDFAAARNHSLQFATGDWIFIIDGDETLDISSQAVFRQRVAQFSSHSEPLAYHFYRMIPGQQRLWIRKLFRRLPGLAFEGAVHEYPAIQGAWLPAAYCPDLVLHHPIVSPEARRRTILRDAPILQRMLTETADLYQQAVYYRHLAEGAQFLGHSLEALQAFESAYTHFHAAQVPKQQGFYHHILVPLIRLSILNTDQMTRAAMYAHELVTHFPHFPEGWMYQGYAQFWLGQLDEAAEAYHQALQLLQDANVPKPVQQRTDHISRLGLARIDLLQNRIAAGIATLSTLYTHNPNPELACHLARAYVLGQDMSQALSYWEKAQQPACDNPTDLVASLLTLDVWSPLEHLSLSELQ